MKAFRLIAVVVVVVTLLAAWSSGASARATIKVTYVEHAITDTVGDVAPAGDSVGDTLGFANPVFDAQNTKQVGTDNGACWRTAVGKSWECVWTLLLSDGQITVEGPYLDAGDSVLAITGGTGVYQTARGQMTLHARDANGSAYDFAYEIVK